MLSFENIPSISNEEILARYITHKREFRRDGTVKPTLFVPYKHVELSVNRHLECSEDEIWQFGIQVATRRSRKLIARCDVAVSACAEKVALKVKASPLQEDNNPNHADIYGYPEKKNEQLSIAQKLVACASNCIASPVI